MLDNAEIEKLVVEFIKKRFLRQDRALGYEESLFANNVIDSFGMLELIAFIEKSFKIRISPSEVKIENFDTIGNILRLINSKVKEA